MLSEHVQFPSLTYFNRSMREIQKNPNWFYIFIDVRGILHGFSDIFTKMFNNDKIGRFAVLQMFFNNRNRKDDMDAASLDGNFQDKPSFFMKNLKEKQLQ